MKSVLLIGLGRFGRRMARKLRELHHDVLAIDRNEQRVNEALDFMEHLELNQTQAMIAAQILKEIKTAWAFCARWDCSTSRCPGRRALCPAGRASASAWPPRSAPP